jgi:predicted lysophospholipase L1 biosynthesis ABC-type transport system permease subunit
MKHWTILSFLLSLCLGLLAWDAELFLQLGEPDSRAAAGIFAQIAATMLGFLIAALSILASISSHRLLRKMQEEGHYRVLLRRFFINSTAYAVAMLAAFIVIIFKKYFPVTMVAAFVAFSFATLLLADIGWRLWLVLHNLTPDKDS